MKVGAIVGPTAVGKTDVALEVATRIGAEIVSVDSMQIYKGMNIGTATPPPEITDRVPHHLLDLFEPERVLSVQEFQTLARAAVEDITSRGRVPLLVGGSGLYFRAVVDDLRFPPRSAEVRARLEDEIESEGAPALHERLRKADPVAAERIEPQNARRIVRALEVVELTGRPFSENDTWERYESIYALTVIGLTRARPDLFARIEARVAAMLDEGLLEEVESLKDAGMSATARQALGYKQVVEAPPGATPEQIGGEIVKATKRFARRQESWFRADPRVVWFNAAEAGLGERLVAHFRASLELP
ncbi:MAG: tRNA (adenosine(37)-N6)-dimethylallyltransferase MiaA [Actinomycetota bacterium]